MARSRFGNAAYSPCLIFVLAFVFSLSPHPARAAATPELPPALANAGVSPDWWRSVASQSAGPFSDWVFESNQAGAELGGSVSTAGDVNGDGYSDLIVGAPLFDNGQTDEGRAFVFYGSATGLSLTPDWTTESNVGSALYGTSVAAAGDVNGDGFGDVIVGAPFFQNGQSEEGAIYVYHGSASGLSTTPARVIESNRVGAAFGWSVCTAGDVNQDGFADVIVGAPLDETGQVDEGLAYVFMGSSTGIAASAAWIGEQNGVGAQYGISVSTAGDVNGDGFADVIVGADRFDNGQNNEGRAFVYMGGFSGLSLIPAWFAESDQAQAQFGHSVAGAGDVNGDGYSDVIIGANLYDNIATDEGRAYIFNGSATGLANIPSWASSPNQAGDHWGESVATAGDFNGDGYADVFVGAPFYGNTNPHGGGVFLYAGSATGPPLFGAIFAFGFDGQAARYGGAVCTAGDVDGDGASDIVVGAINFSNGQANEGKVFVYTGHILGLSLNFPANAEGTASGIEFGASVAMAGDVNGDGYSDVLVGAPGFDNGQTDEGRAFLYLGGPTGLAATAAWTAEPNIANEHFGYSVAGAGDVNGDGYSDVVIGTNVSGGGQQHAFVYHGSPSGLGATPAWTGTNAQANAGYGNAVAGAGDVNGDGFADVLVGAPGFDNGQTDEGRAFLYAGSATGLSLTPLWTAESNQAAALFGSAVASAGDVNNNGFSDVVVGAPAFSNGQVAEGRAFLYLGSAGGPAAVPAWTGESDQGSASFGCAVSTAGDMNGDGFSDFAVGAKNYVLFGTHMGRVYVLLGASNGIPSSPILIDGNSLEGHLGQALSPAGDANQDGFSDLLIGADIYFVNWLRPGNFAGGGGEGGGANVGAVVFSGTSTGVGTSVWAAGIDLSASRYGAAVGGAGDVDGDAFPDVVVGEPGYDPPGLNDAGRIHEHGNWNDGQPRIARQARTDDTAPIAILGRSDSPTGIRLKTLGRSAGGRGRVRIQYEVKPTGTPFDGSGLVSGPFTMTGTPGAIGSTTPLSILAGGLSPGSVYHWRQRVVTDSPYFPPSRWLWAPDNAVTEADARTASSTTGIEVTEAPSAASWLAAATPNPVASDTEIAYALPAAAAAGATHLEVGIYDVNGRKVAMLADGQPSAGRHVVRWDGRDAGGRQLPAGVYFVRLDLPGHQEARKVVLAR
jgi:hypothetical protein